MMPQRLPPLKRFRKLGEWLNDLWDHVYSITPVASRNVRVSRTTRGTAYVGTASAEAEGSLNFRGEWDPSFGSSYAVLEIVKISVGLEAGTYIAVEAIAAGDATQTPWTGTGWILIGRINDQSGWL